jgi:hypothetical protein
MTTQSRSLRLADSLVREPKKIPCSIPADPEQRLDITCAHCGKRIDFRLGEVYTNWPSYVCADHANLAPATAGDD